MISPPSRELYKRAMAGGGAFVEGTEAIEPIFPRLPAAIIAGSRIRGVVDGNAGCCCSGVALGSGMVVCYPF